MWLLRTSFPTSYLGVQEVRHHHETKLRILVRLRPNEAVSVCHGDRLLESLGKALQLVQVSDGVHAAAPHRVVVPGDAPHHDHAGVGAVHHRREELRNHQEVGQEVDLHGLLVLIHRPLGIRERRLVDAGIADQPVDRLRKTELVDLLAELLDGIERIQLAVHGREVLRVEAIQLRHCFHLVKAANRDKDSGEYRWILPSSTSSIVLAQNH